MIKIKSELFMEEKIIYLGLLLGILGSLVLSGCSVGPSYGYTDVNKKYYQGYDSLQMEFLQDSPPYVFYYDSENPTNNEIPIIVQVKNTGVSDAFGALYIHGYDRSIISVAGDTGINSANIYLTGSGSDIVLQYLNVYLGLRGTGSTVTTAGFTVNGITYGANVFTQGNQVRGLDIGVTSGRVGSRIAPIAIEQLAQYTGYNAPIALEGDTPLSPGGGIEVYDFPALVYNLPPSLDQFQQPIMITACFDYVTHSTAMICIDPKPRSNTKKACIAQTVSMGSGQGAPVAITRVEQQASSSKTVFTIYIHHNRQNSLDDLYDYTSWYKCNPESQEVVKPTDKNVVYIGYIALSGNPLTCTPNYKIRLDNSGNGQIACTATFPPNAESAYEAPLEVELWYSYSKNIYKEITIKRI
jgi:hypothetical protein